MYICHSKKAVNIGLEFGWCPGARYTNLRDVKHLGSPQFLDIDWKNYSFDKHLSVAKEHRPELTIARDVECMTSLHEVLKEADQLLEYCDQVAIVPKDPNLASQIKTQIPKRFILAFSVPTKYGGTKIPTKYFDRPVHLLGGRPDVQRRLADEMKVASLDCNRFTFDAKFGDFFDGKKFVPHPEGGYEKCLRASYQNINQIWENYDLRDYL